MKKLLALALCAVLLLGLALPAGAILEFILLDEVLEIVNPTDPPPPQPTPAPNFNLGSLELDIQLPTAKPTLGIYQTPGPVATVRIPLPSKPPADNPQPPAATPKPKPPAKPPSGSLKDAELTSFGLYFEDFRPKLTDEWYMFTPIDLGVNSKLSYPLVAENAWIVGSVTITVRGNLFSVAYQAAEGVKVKRAFFTVVNTLDDLKTLNPKLLASQQLPFGQAINIKETFGDDRLVVLYLNNTADFKTNLAGVTAFVPEQHQLFMQNLIGLVD